jgi:uncharacterized protein (TIGR00369 family)
MTAQSEIASLFSRIPFQRHAQLELLDDLRVRAPDIPELKNHFGTVHGGMLYALGEVAAAVAMAQLLAADRARLYAITRQGEITYLKPARGAITSLCQVAMTGSEILDALEHQRSVDVPVFVALHDHADVVVARLSLVWYVALLK